MPPRHDPAGLATLEWLLVIAAAGGFAAAMTVAFQNLLDDAGRAPLDAGGRLIDAGIDAARISDEAITPQIVLETSTDDTALAEASDAQAPVRRPCIGLPRHARRSQLDLGHGPHRHPSSAADDRAHHRADTHDGSRPHSPNHRHARA